MDKSSVAPKKGKTCEGGVWGGSLIPPRGFAVTDVVGMEAFHVKECPP